MCFVESNISQIQRQGIYGFKCQSEGFYFSFERIILDGFYKMRLRNGLMCGVRSLGALDDCNLFQARGQSIGNESRAAGEEGWAAAVGGWYSGAERLTAHLG